MLEFQPNFFKPEIREGFYIDATMKTMWAAELEVLQTVATICETHGLTWYAAFGTLLGAIRHEGFVPWDDDIDIVMFRKDYDRLMELLPKELPAGYHFRSAFSEEGYSEYHSNILNSDGIDTGTAFLQRFHNCPFTVGIDIFPLDVLPDDEEERKKQREQFALARKVARMAQGLAEVNSTGVQAVTDLQNAMQELERKVYTKFREAWIRQGQYDQIMCKALRVANQIAGQYADAVGEGVVMFNDYAVSGSGILSSEWYAEVYSATFEEFMIPVPSGYDEILRATYGDYMVRRKGMGCHEYPFYAHQLRQLRSILKERQAQAIAKGLMVPKQEEHILPQDWEEQTLSAKEKGQKILLYISGLPMYSEYEGQALDKLEYNLGLFHENRDKVLLWWRPSAQMHTMLGLLSPDLAERYDGILAQYKAAGWGICDESEDEERAVELCDAYYGEMSENARMVNQEGKPVMVEQVV